MANRARHEHEAEISRLIENWARWPGFNGGGSSRSSAAWIMDFVTRRQGECGPSVPVMGGEAADTHTAIGRMPSELSRALVAYYTGRGQLAERARLFNKGRRGQARVGERTFQRRVDEARDAFWQLWLEVRRNSNQVGAANRAAQPLPQRPDFAHAATRERPTSGPVRWIKTR
jgi:hypothetical protein